MTKSEDFKPKRSIKEHPLFHFTLMFIIMFPIDYLLDGEERSVRESLTLSLFMGIWMAFIFRYLTDTRTPVYFKRKFYGEVEHEVVRLGGKIRKVKNEKKIYLLPLRNWPARKIIIEKSPFYARIHVRGKMISHFYNWIKKQGYGIIESK